MEEKRRKGFFSIANPKSDNKSAISKNRLTDLEEIRRFQKKLVKTGQKYGYKTNKNLAFQAR